MKEDTFKKMRLLVRDLENAGNGGEVKPRLYSDAKYALLACLDELKEAGLVGEVRNPYFSGEEE